MKNRKTNQTSWIHLPIVRRFTPYGKTPRHLWEWGGCMMMIMWGAMITPGFAESDPFSGKVTAPKVEVTQGLEGQALPLDQTNWTKPQSAFLWIAMARDYKTSWDSFGRQGWMTDDAYFLPVDPGVSEFTPDTEVFYIVFAAAALDAPSQYRAAWYYMPDGKTREAEMAGTDALTLDMNEKSGYLEIYRPPGGWKKGKYLIRLFFESPGQELYDPNVVGTMEFTITDHPRNPSPSHETN